MVLVLEFIRRQQEIMFRVRINLDAQRAGLHYYLIVEVYYVKSIC